MPEITIYHNPKCSKSRKTLEILKNKGLDPTIIEYLKHPLNLQQLKTLLSHFDIKEFVRTNENVFREQQLSLDDEENILRVMVTEPILMQRPIVTFQGKAIIGRPPEKVLELFSN